MPQLSSLSSIEQILIVLSALAGAVHVLSPDHWLPTSVLAWQRGWRVNRIAVFSITVLGLHVLFGFLLYLGFYEIAGGSLVRLDTSGLLVFALVLMVLMTALRGFRFARMKEVFGMGPNNLWGAFAVISLLGPCESIIPIFVKTRQMGVGYLLPFSAFLIGTVISGTIVICVGRSLWNRPLWLPRGLNWAHGRLAAVPFAACVAVGLTYLLKLSVSS